VKLGARDPTNLLFSSGTTGTPKAIPWNQTTPIKAAAGKVSDFIGKAAMGRRR